MNWLLMVVVGIVGIFTYRGYKKGIVKMAFSLTTLIFSVVITYFLAPAISDSMCDSEIIVGYMSEMVNESFGIEEALLQMTQEAMGTTWNTQQQRELLNSVGLPEAITDSVLSDIPDQLSDTGKSATHKLSVLLCNGIACVMIRSIVYMVVFILTKVILKVATVVFGVIDHLPVIENVSRTAGALVGFVSSILIVWLLFLCIFACSGTAFGMACNQCIEQSAILQSLYRSNVLLHWLLGRS